MEIRTIAKSEIPDAMALVWEVFQEFEAPEYTPEGLRTFKEFIDCQAYHTTIEMFGAFEGDTLLGVIATRNQGSHIALFFVKKENHGQGLGRKLFEYIASRCNNNTLTVNSSPYAAEIYRKLGFVDLDHEQLTNGLRYIPMRFTYI